MSTTTQGKRRITVPDFRARKGRDKLVMLTAYSASVAARLAPHVDALLVGDSLGMVLYGLPSTLPVTLDMMALHTQAVRRGAPDSFIVTDMPFGSYQESPQQAFAAAAMLLKTSGADAVKLEGGAELAPTVAFLQERGLPVMGHVGLMPQRINQLGRFKAQGRDEAAAATIKADAAAIAEAGAFALVLEGVLEPVAAAVTASVAVPIIGIGASPRCDGQILVSDDLFGLFGAFTPSFVRRYAEVGEDIADAAAQFAADVRSGAFPAEKECFMPAARPQAVLRKA